MISNILNIYVYKDQNDQLIKVRLEIISPHTLVPPVNIMQYALKTVSNDIYRRMDNPRLGDKVILENLITQYKSDNEKDPFNALKLEDIDFKVENNEFKVASVIYTLPNNPLLILQWLCSLSVFVNTVRYDHCYFQQSVAEDLPQLVLPNDFYNYFNKSTDHKKGILLKLHEELLAFAEDESYKNTFQVMNKMLEFYREQRQTDNPLPILECMQRKHSEMLWGDLSQSLVTPEMHAKTKLQQIFKTARTLIYSDQTKELNQMFNSINFLAKRKFFGTCIGKPAHDGGPSGYSWNYTEFPLFLDNKVQFTLRSDGLMSISGYLDTDGYKDNYAKGRRNHRILEDEMKFIAVILGLEFMPGDFHKEMVFTKESTEKLMAHGLHYNTQYVKNLFKMQNYSNFFRRHMPDLSDVFNTVTYLSLENLDAKESLMTLELRNSPEILEEENKPNCSM